MWDLVDANLKWVAAAVVNFALVDILALRIAIASVSCGTWTTGSARLQIVALHIKVAPTILRVTFGVTKLALTIKALQTFIDIFAGSVGSAVADHLESFRTREVLIIASVAARCVDARNNTTEILVTINLAFILVFATFRGV